jgi:hypothetical protein
LEALCSAYRAGSHEVLINAVGEHMNSSGKRDCKDHAHDFKVNISKLKKLRVIADYENAAVDSAASKIAMRLSYDIIRILKKYL